MESREIRRIMSAKELPDVMTMPIVARTLGCSLNTAYALLNRQDFPRSVAGNRVYIDKEKFLAWLDAQTERRRRKQSKKKREPTEKVVSGRDMKGVGRADILPDTIS